MKSSVHRSQPDLILFGIQGSGKGTQGERLVQDHQYQPFVTGDALRSIAQTDTEVGHRVKPYIESGTHAPNDVVMQAVGQAIEGMSPQDRILFDGMPRNEEQKKLLDTILADLHRTALAIHLVLSDDKALQRMSARGRPDDKDPQVVETRIKTFKEKTVPVIEAFRAEGRLVEVSADAPPQKVYADIQRVLGLYSDSVASGMQRVVMTGR